MEEVDKIIIDSLRHLDCDIDEGITTLRHFTPDNVVAAISSCIEVMNPQVKLPKKLPSSMSARIKFASSLAQQIKEFGFKGDMGYQTILYCNEVEVRRVLMFLIEHLPKESSPVVDMEPMGYVPMIVKQIEDSLRHSLSQMWLPSEVLSQGIRCTEQGMIVNSFGSSCPVDSVKLVVPNDDVEALYVSPVTKQCSPRQLLPSLLFEESGVLRGENLNEILEKVSVSGNISEEILANIPSSKSSETVNDYVQEDKKGLSVPDSEAEELLNKLSQRKDALIGLQETVVKKEGALIKLKLAREEEQKLLKDAIAKVKVKNKTLAVLNNEENIIKLKNLIRKAENRLLELANQWNEVQTPLVEEHKSLKSSVSSDNLKQRDDQNKLGNLRKTYKELVKDFKEKNALEQNLIERCKDLNKKNNRAAYTKRILEIVGNIKKQNKEIQKILSDTRQVQKDINTLTGQVDRSFTLSDELIFNDCKYDESARKAYKFLASLREECNNILQAVSDMGQAERELRNLEEQVEAEKSKNIQDKLDKVQRDLAEIRKEIQMLM